jgi:putative proteasome-type protease
MRLNEGLVFLSDSRTNAGVDQISTFRKMLVFERTGDRLLVLMTAGNLAISQAIRQLVSERVDVDGSSIWTVPNLYEAARMVGEAVREVRERDAKALEDAGIEFNVSIILGGQIKGERCRLFLVYAAGNFIEAHTESPYFQIGEAKYGKPVVDRMITPESSLEEGAKCALVSMDSTLRSNISVGLPLDLLCYETESLHVTRFVSIDQSNEYFNMIHNTWGRRLKQVFSEIPDPVWSEVSLDAPRDAIFGMSPAQSAPVRAIPPAALSGSEDLSAKPFQTLAEQSNSQMQRV